MSTTTTDTAALDAAVFAVLATADRDGFTPSAIARKLRAPHRGLDAGTTYAAAMRLVRAGRARDRWRGTSLVYFTAAPPATTTTTTTTTTEGPRSMSTTTTLADFRAAAASTIPDPADVDRDAHDVGMLVWHFDAIGRNVARAHCRCGWQGPARFAGRRGADDAAVEDGQRHRADVDRVETLRIMSDAGFTPYVWDGWTYYGPHRTERSEAPAGGRTAYLSNYRAVRGDESPDAWEMPVTVWGDYCGDDYGRSNHGALLEDYGPLLVDVSGDYWSRALLIPATIGAEDAATLAEIGTALRDEYPLYDEQHHSAMEMEAASDAWTDYLGDDVRWSLTRDHGIDAEDVDACADVIRDLFYTAAYAADDYPRFESATSIVFADADAHIAEIAAALVERGCHRETA